jgi:hypothetical protein
MSHVTAVDESLAAFLLSENAAQTKGMLPTSSTHLTSAEKIMSALTMQEHELLGAIRRINEKIAQQTNKLVVASEVTAQPLVQQRPTAPLPVPAYVPVPPQPVKTMPSQSNIPAPPSAPKPSSGQPAPQPQRRPTVPSSGGSRTSKPSLLNEKVSSAADAMQAMMLANRPRAQPERTDAPPVVHQPMRKADSYLQSYLHKHST